MRGNAALLAIALGAASGCYDGVGDDTSPLETFGTSPIDGDDDPTAASDPTVDDDEEDGESSGGGDDAPPDDGGMDPAPELEPLTTDQVRFYLGMLAPALAGRSLSYDENARIQAEGEAAIIPLIDEWTLSPGFADSMRDMVQNELQASGERDGIDFELPGNLVAQVVSDGLPWSTILTADYCVDAVGSMIECDTGAPFEAGVLATRAYLIPNKGRFNLTRALRMLEVFACRGYPMEPDIQIPLEKDIFIPDDIRYTVGNDDVSRLHGHLVERPLDDHLGRGIPHRVPGSVTRVGSDSDPPATGQRGHGRHCAAGHQVVGRCRAVRIDDRIPLAADDDVQVGTERRDPHRRRERKRSGRHHGGSRTDEAKEPAGIVEASAQRDATRSGRHCEERRLGRPFGEELEIELERAVDVVPHHEALVAARPGRDESAARPRHRSKGIMGGRLERIAPERLEVGRVGDDESAAAQRPGLLSDDGDGL